MTPRPRVAVRELRQNLSVYLRRTLAGETLEVTDRGQPVALLTPIPERADAVARLVSEGRIAPPRGNLLDLGPPLDVPLEKPLSEILEELREDSV